MARKSWLLLVAAVIVLITFVLPNNNDVRDLPQELEKWTKVSGTTQNGESSFHKDQAFKEFPRSSDSNATTIRGKQTEQDFSQTSAATWPQVDGEELSSLLKRASQSVQKDQVEGIEFYWQLPPHDATDSRIVSPPRAILFLAHGCNHAGSDWWPNDPITCPECLGLPEERAIVAVAHSAKFRMITVAMSSHSEIRRKCWGNSDGPRVAKVIQQFQALFPNIPTFAFGASSGGRLVSSMLPVVMKKTSLPLDGYISQIMGPSKKLAFPEGTKSPATAFITMPKDTATLQNVKKFVKTQIDNDRPALHIEVQAYALSPTFFHERIPSISLDLSAKLFDALRNEEGLLTSTFELVHDPRHFVEWKTPLRSILKSSSKDGLEPDHSHICEVMNVAYGMHEMTRDGVAQALEWLLEQSTKS
ncbi:hypothetical protein ACA910_005899 [Epithemia clementina (nom. ined.)]